jgi:hypothetical protein
LQNRSPPFSCTTSKTDSKHKKASSFGSRDYHKHPSNIYKQSRAHGCHVAERTNQRTWSCEFQLPLTTANQKPENSLRSASGELLYRSYRYLPNKK